MAIGQIAVPKAVPAELSAVMDELALSGPGFLARMLRAW